MKVILSDIDGVILDFLTSFKNYLKSVNVKIVPINKYDDVFDNYKKYYIQYLETQPYINYYSGALDYFNYLSQNYKIVLLTSINKSIEKSRIKNLKDLNYTDIIFTKEKEKFIKQYSPIFIYEDCPDTIKKYLKVYSGFIYCPIRPYTKEVNYKQVIKYDYC